MEGPTNSVCRMMCVCEEPSCGFWCSYALQLPAGFRFEPLNLAQGNVVTLPAGSGLPETSISVMNGAGNRVVKSLICGHRQQLKVVGC